MHKGPILVDTTDTDSVSGLIPVNMVKTKSTKSKNNLNEYSPDIQAVKRKTRQLSRN